MSFFVRLGQRQPTASNVTLPLSAMMCLTIIINIVRLGGEKNNVKIVTLGQRLQTAKNVTLPFSAMLY